jgi:hypothetical protein
VGGCGVRVAVGAYAGMIAYVGTAQKKRP